MQKDKTETWENGDASWFLVINGIIFELLKLNEKFAIFIFKICQKFSSIQIEIVFFFGQYANAYGFYGLFLSESKVCAHFLNL